MTSEQIAEGQDLLDQIHDVKHQLQILRAQYIAKTDTVSLLTHTGSSCYVRVPSALRSEIIRSVENWLKAELKIRQEELDQL